MREEPWERRSRHGRRDDRAQDRVEGAKLYERLVDAREQQQLMLSAGRGRWQEAGGRRR